uniref:Uncharacterized protein n=1 Tax=Caenorhabditis tropicalis TaxID=1561998 RepID=A0A1I7UL05_9PELO
MRKREEEEKRRGATIYVYLSEGLCQWPSFSSTSSSSSSSSTLSSLCRIPPRSSAFHRCRRLMGEAVGRRSNICLCVCMCICAPGCLQLQAHRALLRIDPSLLSLRRRASLLFFDAAFFCIPNS